MNYKINFNNYKNNFSLPMLVVADDLKDVNSDYLKIILMIFKNPDKDYSVNLLSNLLNLPEEIVTDAINYWINKGVLLDSEGTTLPVQIISSIKPMIPPEKPINDGELKFLLSSVQTMLGRPATSIDIKTITYVYEYYRLPADVILMAVQFCVEKGKNSIKYIEAVCTSWYDKGIVNHAMAEEYLKQAAFQTTNEGKVKQMFGIAGRNLLSSEEKFIISWFAEFNFSLDVIELAYEKTIKNTGKVAFAYTNKILLNWHKKGYKTLDDIVTNEQTEMRESGSTSDKSYDLDMLDKYWDKVPTLNNKFEK